MKMCRKITSMSEPDFFFFRNKKSCIGVFLFMLRLEASIPTVVGWLVGLQKKIEKVFNTKKGLL